MAGHFDWDYEVKDGTNQQQTKVDEAKVGAGVGRVKDNPYISAEYRQRLEQLEDDERRWRDKYISQWPAQDRIPTPGDDEC